MGKYNIITIGRQEGSMGKEIGELLSKELGIPLYDNEILAQAAKKSGYSEAVFEKHDEKPTSSFLYALAMGVNTFGHTYQKPLLLEIYLAQFDAIKKLASEGPGIFIGRCSDYVLNDVPGVFNIFVHADMEDRIKYFMKEKGVNEKEARDMCLRADKDRSSYYNYYSNNQWGDSRHYDLCINTSKVSVKDAVEIVKNCVK